MTSLGRIGALEISKSSNNLENEMLRFSANYLSNTLHIP